jgi:hypothetical protein
MMRRALWLPVILAACASAPESVASATDQAPEPLPALADEGVRVALVADPDGGLVLRLDLQGVEIGSLQGELTFDPAVLAVSRAVPVTGAFVALNTDELAAGRLRFAAFSPGALSPGHLVELVADSRSALSRVGVRVHLDAAGTLDANPLDRSRLHGSEGVYRVEP